jgi:membrane protease YdiL (CAAX protease family)
VAAPDADRPDRTPTGGADVAWAGWVSVLDAVVIYIGAQLLATVLVTAWVVGVGAGEGVPLVLIVLVSPVSLGAGAFLWLRVRYADRTRDVLGRRSWALSDVGIGALVGVGAFFVILQIVLRIVVGLFERQGLDVPNVQETFQIVAQDPAAVPLLVLATLVLAPFAEELVYRGIVFQGMRARTGFWPAALVSAAAFTLPHLGDGGGAVADLVIAIGILPLGILFAAAMERWGSLLLCAAAHSAYNAGGVAILLLTSGAGSS